MALTLNPQTYKAIKTVNTAVESWQMWSQKDNIL